MARTKPIQRTQRSDVFGHIPGVPVNTAFRDRQECANAAVHASVIKGIHGRREEGAFSVVMSGGYEDDKDEGYRFTYTGSGGFDKGPTGQNRSGRQTRDQSFDDHENKALQVSSMTGKPVRVLRGFRLAKLGSDYAPAEGYRYDGLYRVESAWLEKGHSGFMMCRYLFRRLEGQPPIPRRDGIVPVNVYRWPVAETAAEGDVASTGHSEPEDEDIDSPGSRSARPAPSREEFVQGSSSGGARGRVAAATRTTRDIPPPKATTRTIRDIPPPKAKETSTPASYSSPPPRRPPGLSVSAASPSRPPDRTPVLDKAPATSFGSSSTKPARALADTPGVQNDHSVPVVPVISLPKGLHFKKNKRAREDDNTPANGRPASSRPRLETGSSAAAEPALTLDPRKALRKPEGKPVASQGSSTRLPLPRTPVVVEQVDEKPRLAVSNMPNRELASACPPAEEVPVPAVDGRPSHSNIPVSQAGIQHAVGGVEGAVASVATDSSMLSSGASSSDAAELSGALHEMEISSADAVESFGAPLLLPPGTPAGQEQAVRVKDEACDYGDNARFDPGRATEESMEEGELREDVLEILDLQWPDEDSCVRSQVLCIPNSPGWQ